MVDSIRPAHHSTQPVVAIAHSGDIHLINKLGLTTIVARTLNRASTRIVFVSRLLFEQFLARIQTRRLQDWLKQTAVITPMGIDVGHFSNLRAQRHHSSRFHLVFLGRLVPIKGVEVLLAALAHLPVNERQSLHVTIAGDGPSRSRLESLARSLKSNSQTISFAGEVRGSDRDALFRSADVLILPSVPRPDGRSEGTPVTALESMAAGVPVIASRVGGLMDIPSHAITLVPPNDPIALGQAIAGFRANPDRAQQQLLAASEYVKTFDWSRVGPRLWAGCADPTI